MTEYQKLKSIIDEIDVLIEKRVTSDSPEFEAWKTKAQRFLIKQFGENSLEYRKLSNTRFSLMVYTLSTTHAEFVKACKDGLLSTRAIFQTYLEEMSNDNIIEETIETIEPVNKSGEIVEDSINYSDLKADNS